MARRSLFQRFPYETRYSKATGWREEGDFQMNAFLHDYKLLMTNETHVVHLDVASVREGGARTNELYAILCVLFNSNLFYRKYGRAYAQKTGIRFRRSAGFAATGARPDQGEREVVAVALTGYPGW